ncbi:MAG: ATPase [Gammaproteobacteria bacterium]|nr:ATPase [Gammaproteobacteria bacterium]
MDKYSNSRKDQLFKAPLKDMYKSDAKLKEPTLCMKCDALYQGGRWTWGTPDTTPDRGLCPACQRIADNCPAGFVAIDKGFYESHRREIQDLVKATEEKEKSEHPLERLIAIAEEPDQVLVTTTGVHLAQRLGHALTASYKGHAEYQYDDQKTRLDVYWERDKPGA